MDEKPTCSRSDLESRRAYSRWHYRQNKSVYKRRAREKTIETRGNVRGFISSFLSCHPCVDCGELDPVVLEFDHRPETTKQFEISEAVRRTLSIATVMREIEKCDVRCANCHRRITYKRLGRTDRGIIG